MSASKEDARKKWARRVRVILDPSTIQEPRAKEGTNFLLRMSDVELLKTFKRVGVDKLAPTQVMEELAKPARLTPEQQGSLLLALRRMVLVGLPLAKELQALKVKKKVKPVEPEVIETGELRSVTAINFIPPVEMGPETDFDTVLHDCYASSLAVNGMEEIKFLVELQKRRLFRMMRQYARLPNPFLSSRLLDSTLEAYRKSLETLILVQARTNTLVPDAIPFESEVRATFDVYQRRIMDSGSHSRDQMMDAMVKFVEMIQNEYADLRVPKPGLGSNQPSDQTRSESDGGNIHSG